MIKEFKSGDGCRFMCTCLPGSTSVFDMDVDDGVEVVEFEGFDDVSIGKVAEKSFPSVKTLVIGEEVECMSIPNEMFPNVRNIISYNRHFLNSDMLIRVDYNMFPDKNGKRTDVWLLNTFCKKPDEVINLKSVEFIDGYAFYGCRSTKIINEDCVKGGFKLAFFGSAFMELEPVGGAYMAGSMIIDVDKAYENVDAYRKRKKCDKSIVDSVENLVSSIFNTTTYAGLPSEEDARKLVHHFLETGDVACTVKITIGERTIVRQKYINHLDLPSMVSIVRGWMAGWHLITTMSSNLYYSLGIVIESFLTTRSEENTSDRLCLSNLNIFDTVFNTFGSEATAKLIAEDVFCDKQMQDSSVPDL